jgi:hypothetical protein
MPLQSTSGAATYDAFGVSAVSSVVPAEAIDYDGTNDFLTSSSLTGAADGRAFTLSTWAWSDGGNTILDFGTGSQTRFRITLDGTGLNIEARNAAGTLILESSTVFSPTPNNTFLHILVSVNLTSTATRSVYINDSLTSTTWSTYSNADIDFTVPTYRIAGQSDASASSKFDGRLSNVFLDYTYRDMSITANRRLFVTADLKPALGQAALSPILYLPMSDPTAPGLNQGTGGNFTLTGVVARSGRGPNQYNAPYSSFNSSSTFLSRTTNLTGASASSAITFAASFIIKGGSSDRMIFQISPQDGQFAFSVQVNSVEQISVSARNSAGTPIFSFNLSTGFSQTDPAIFRNFNLVFSFDLTSTATRFVALNGVLQSVGYGDYSNSTVNVAPTTNPRLSVGASTRLSPGGGGTDSYYFGQIGALWFNTSYIDLSVAANLAKFVSGTGINAAPVDLGATGELPTGTSPLVYLPLYGNNAGRNYGTGGDFTVNSGPFPGARGPNEFWGNWCGEENGDVGYLSRTGVSGIGTGKTFSLRTRMQTRVGVAGTRTILSQQSPNFFIEVNGVDALVITARNAAGTVILSATSANSAIVPGTLYDLSINIDLSNTANRRVSLNGGANDLSMTWSTYTNDTFGLNTSTLTRVFCRATDTTSLFYGKLGEFYFTTDYIDFSVEANRLKFRDAFGNPVNLTQQIESQAIPTPAIYLRFPPGAFGTNYGSGGAFTQSGNMYDGGQF